jgi:hypothetical protein
MVVDAAFEHCVTRARERFKWNLSRGEWANMSWLVKQGQAERLKPAPDAPLSHHAMYRIEFRGRRLRLGFDEFTGKVLTIMDPASKTERRYSVGEISGTTLAPVREEAAAIERVFEARTGHKPFANAPSKPTGLPSIWDPPATRPPPYVPPAIPVRDPSGPQEPPPVDEPLPVTEAMVEAEGARLDTEREQREHAAGEPGQPDASKSTEVKPMGKERDVTPGSVVTPEEKAREGVDDRALVRPVDGPPEMTAPPAVAIHFDVNTFAKMMDAYFEVRKRALDKLKITVHYGKVPGVPKDFLWQEGAEVIAIGFLIAPAPPIIELDAEHDDTIEGTTFRSYTVRVRVPLVLRMDPSHVVWAGRVRQASMSEKVYRSQLARHQNDKGFWVEAQPFGQLKGKVYETAQKRAFVHSVRLYSGVGDRFTQDEDIHDGSDGKQALRSKDGPAEAPRVKSTQAPVQAPQSAAPAPASAPVDSGPASQATLTELMGICKTAGLKFSDALKKVGCTGTLTEAKAREAITKVRS